MKLSIIIPSFNTSKETCECLKSIYGSLKEFSNYEVIVFDNNSSDNTVAQIKHKYPSVNLIQNKVNLGYGKGNNAAVARAQGEVILFLNSDILVLNRAIQTI